MRLSLCVSDMFHSYDSSSWSARLLWSVSFICVSGVYHSNLESLCVVIVEVIGDSWRVGDRQLWLRSCMEWL